jgi:hypothetical protein
MQANPRVWRFVGYMILWLLNESMVLSDDLMILNKSIDEPNLIFQAAGFFRYFRFFGK